MDDNVYIPSAAVTSYIYNADFETFIDEFFYIIIYTVFTTTTNYLLGIITILYVCFVFAIF